MSYSIESIIEYYNQCNNAYRDAWKLDKDMQLNLGLWKKRTKNLSQALKNLNEEIGIKSEIKKGELHLDAGCGVGGTAIHFSKKFDCKSIGISIVKHQIDKAKENAQKAGIAQSTDFILMDYTKTTFSDNTFDAITGIESICYAEPKSAFIEEAYRILKPGGRLVLAENLQSKEKLSSKEYDLLYTNAFHGCRVSSLNTKEEYQLNLENAGFKNFEYEDFTRLIKPSIKRLRRFFYPAWVYNKYHQLVGKPFSDVQVANTKMCYYLQSSLNKGLWSYGIIKAVK